MLTSFWEGVGGKLADRWAALAGPALIFWSGALLAWADGHGGLDDVDSAAEWVAGRGALVQVLVVVAFLAGVVASVLVVSRLTLPFTRALEGYWPSWLDPLRDVLAKRRGRKIESWEQEFQNLAAKVDSKEATNWESRRFVLLDERLHHVPAREVRRMPTRTGDVLSAAEGSAFDRYGLDAVKCWPALWSVLPESCRTDLTAARQSMDAAVASMIWGLGFCGLTLWAWWALPVGAAVAVVSYLVWVPGRAETYGSLLVAAFDVHRTSLYRKMRWPLPAKPSDEPALGELLTAYLWSGSSANVPVFSDPQDDA